MASNIDITSKEYNMKYLKKLAAISTLLMLSHFSQASLLSLPGDGNYAGAVTSDNGWTFNMGSDQVDFWTFSLAQDATMSFDVVSDIVFGLSLYSGTLFTDPGFNFSNFASFDGLFGESMNYAVGTDPFTPLSGNSLTDIFLTAGNYTLALGGNDVGFDFFGEYQYLMNVSTQSTPQVSEPKVALLMLVLAGLVSMRKRFYLTKR